MNDRVTHVMAAILAVYMAWMLNSLIHSIQEERKILFELIERVAILENPQAAEEIISSIELLSSALSNERKEVDILIRKVAFLEGGVKDLEMEKRLRILEVRFQQLEKR